MKNRWPVIYVFLLALLVFPPMTKTGVYEGVAEAVPAETKLFIETPSLFLAQAASSYPRGHSSSYLGELYQDRGKGFSIRPPAQWWLNRSHPRFTVKFSSRNYEAFIIIDAVPVPSKVWINREFTKFVLEKNREVKKIIPSFQVLSNRRVKLKAKNAYRTEAVFQAGPNKVLMNVYYVPAKTRIFMITTACPEAAALRWDPLLSASINTFTTLE